MDMNPNSDLRTESDFDNERYASSIDTVAYEINHDIRAGNLSTSADWEHKVAVEWEDQIIDHICETIGYSHLREALRAHVRHCEPIEMHKMMYNMFRQAIEAVAIKNTPEE
jgi:hypothetical protein